MELTRVFTPQGIPERAISPNLGEGAECDPPALLDPLGIGSFERGVELPGSPFGRRTCVAHDLDVTDHVAELMPARAPHAKAPARRSTILRKPLSFAR